MKIAIIIRRLNTRGGAQRQAIELARNLKVLGHEPILYTFAYDKDACYGDLLSRLPVISLERKERLSFLPYFLKENRAARALARRLDPATDILNPHGEEAYKVAHYFKKSGKSVPSVWMMNDMPAKTVSYLRAREIGMVPEASLVRRFWHRIFDLIELRFVKSQDKIVVLDDRDREWVRRHYEMDAAVVRSGIDISRFPFLERPGISGKKIKILSTGIFFPHRRYEDSIKAVSILLQNGYDVSLTIIGTGEKSVYASTIRRLAEEDGISDRIIFRGRISDAELTDAYRSHDIFLFIPHLQSWGLAVFEAMATGLPVIITSTSGASEVLSHAQDALIISPKSPEKAAEALLRLAEDGTLYKKISLGGRRFVEQNISWNKYAEGMLSQFAAARASGAP